MPAPRASDLLRLDRCPSCGIAKPVLKRLWAALDRPGYFYATYTCSACPGVIFVTAPQDGGEITACWPPMGNVAEEIPPRAREYLRQAQESLSQPAGAL